MIKRVCVCSRCGKEEKKEAYTISLETAEIGPVDLSSELHAVTGWSPVAVYGTHLCKDCKEHFDKFMKMKKYLSFRKS